MNKHNFKKTGLESQDDLINWLFPAGFSVEKINRYAFPRMNVVTRGISCFVNEEHSIS